MFQQLDTSPSLDELVASGQEFVHRELTSTVINGTTISSVVELTSEDSPYLIAGVLDISIGGTLIIDAGSVLVFETSSSGINVNSGGQLLVTGDLNNRVVLKAHDDEGTWSGIVFGAGSAPGLFGDSMNYVSGSLIQYADIVRAGYSSSYAYSYGLALQEGVVPYILGVDMIDCGGRRYGSAIHIQNLEALAVMRNLRMLHSNQAVIYQQGYGLYASGKNTAAGILVLENLSLEADFWSYSLYLRNINQVSTSRSSFEGRVYFSYIGSLDMAQNSFGGGVEINNPTSLSVPSSVTDNFIKGRLYFYSSNYNVNATIMHNVIQESDNGGIYAYAYTGRLTITNNTIKECTSTNNPVVELISSYYSQGILFTNNSIIDNQGSSVFRLQTTFNYANNPIYFIENFATGNSATNSFILLADYPCANFTRNIFVNNTAPASVEVVMSNYDETILKIPYNHWGTFQSDVTGLRSTVLDGFVHASQPIVDFVSVLESPSVDRYLYLFRCCCTCYPYFDC